LLDRQVILGVAGTNEFDETLTVICPNSTRPGIRLHEPDGFAGLTYSADVVVQTDGNEPLPETMWRFSGGLGKELYPPPYAPEGYALAVMRVALAAEERITITVTSEKWSDPRIFVFGVAGHREASALGPCADLAIIGERRRER